MNDEYFVDTYYDYDYDDDLSLFKFDRDLWGYSDGDRYGNWGSYHSHPSRNSTDVGDGDDKPDAAVYVRAVLGFMVSAYLMLITHRYEYHRHYIIAITKHHTHTSHHYMIDCPAHILCSLGLCL